MIRENRTKSNFINENIVLYGSREGCWRTSCLEMYLFMNQHELPLRVWKFMGSLCWLICHKLHFLNHEVVKSNHEVQFVNQFVPLPSIYILLFSALRHHKEAYNHIPSLEASCKVGGIHPAGFMWISREWNRVLQFWVYYSWPYSQYITKSICLHLRT